MKIIYLKSTGVIKQTLNDEIEVTVTDKGFETYKSLLYFESGTSADDYDIAEGIVFEDGYDDTNYIYTGSKLVYSRKTKLKLMRDKRNDLLQISDTKSLIIWVDRWAMLTTECQDDWIKYRQKLRSIVNLYEADISKDIDNVVWPDEPSVVFKTT